MPKKNTPSLGFGLVELIVSLSIVTIVTGIVMARHNAFNGAILLRNQAYEIAFAIKEAQQLAVSGQTANVALVQKQRYAVAFSTGSNGEVNKQAILLYKENGSNNTFDSGDTKIELIRLDSRFEISSLTHGNTARNNMRVLFERPLFDAKFYHGTNSLVTGPMKITIRPVGSTAASVPQRVIVVTASGQVSVENN